MAAAVNKPATSSEIAIFGRLLSQHKGEMSPSLARYVLTLGFNASEQQRMQDLADANHTGRISKTELEELMGYVKAGHLLALLHSHARKALKKRKVS
jgi:hypothetical protein